MDNSLIKRQAAIDAIAELTSSMSVCISVDECHGMNRMQGMAVRALEGLPSAQKWIQCSDRLPNSNGCYLVWRPNFWGGEIGMPAICYFDGKNTWHDSYGVDFERTLPPNNVIAWMPLPDPYEGEQE